MQCSINEVEAALTKAGLGAGMPVGLAEDASSAGVWLCLHGFGGLEAFLAGIQTQIKPVPPDVDEQTLMFRDARAAYCGPSAFDAIVAGGTDLQIKLLTVDVPLLLLGYAGVTAATYGIEFELTHGNRPQPNSTWTRLSRDAVLVSNTVPEPGADVAIQRSITQWQPTADMLVRPSRDIQVAPDLWHRINELASRTYVPASDASREKGAGAGLVDTD